MPSLMAAMAASLAGYVIDALLEPLLGFSATLVLSLAGSTLAFFYVRRWLTELRGR